MKKLILACILILWAMMGFSQEYYTTDSRMIGVYNESTEKYEWGTREDLDDLPVLVNGNLITVNQKSTYYTYEKIHIKKTKDMTYGSWYAKDDENLKCKVTIGSFNDGRIILIIYYNDVAISYKLNRL